MEKRILIILVAVTAISLMTPVTMQIDQARAVETLAPASCIAAEELGWSSWGWNAMCLADLQFNCCDPIGDPWY